ncbi:hypothetical protein [Gordonia tangerina]|uniref:Uncharacterized protein n=1 Tax=Gordonia tangerina TaxID=2911060 RepID=A0ABS9DL15_9ACTN|nr:hypothetical protein [Gordonia tangerina]MCF3939925.1 hypothetical protein [Gordonia tangerina]
MSDGIKRRYVYDHDTVKRFADTCPMMVSRGGEAQPCDKPAVALRWVDAHDGSYHATPVCVNHCRKGEMVELRKVFEGIADVRS